MCGSYSFIPPADFYDRLKIVNRDFKLADNYNVAPGQMMPVVTANSPKKVEEMKWGLIPFWSQDPSIGYKMINARSEEIDKKPSFRKPIRNQRCLIPASGFYEWKTVPQKNEKTKKRKNLKKTPYFIHLKNRDWFCFAGIYDIWKDKDGKEIKTYAIITTEPNEVMAKIHNRMPVILEEKDEDKWSDNSIFSPELLKLLNSYESGEMEAYQVSPMVNNPQNNSVDLLKPN